MYVKIFGSILTSSVWSEDLETRLTWIALLAMADADGFVRGADEGIARVANLPPTKFQRALGVLAAPDTRRPGQEHEGRRIERTPDGILILNYTRYRDTTDSDTMRDRTRERVRRHRERHDLSQAVGDQPSGPPVTPVTPVTPGNADVTPVTLGNTCNADVTLGNAVKRSVTLGNARKRYTDTDTDTDTPPVRAGRGARARVTWVTPYLAAWEQQHGAGSGSTLAGQMAKALAPLHQAHGEAEVVRRLARYLTETEARYATPTRFAQTFGSWDGAGSGAARASPGTGSPSTRQSRARDGLRAFLSAHSSAEVSDAECARGGEVSGPVQRALPDAGGQRADSGGVDDCAA